MAILFFLMAKEAWVQVGSNMRFEHALKKKKLEALCHPNLRGLGCQGCGSSIT
jgi:hypothetical protein